MRYLIIATILWVNSPGFGNVTGSDLQNFNSTTSGLDFVTVHSSETLSPGIANFGLFANYAVNTLPRYSDVVESSSKTSAIEDSLTAADFNFSLGITENMDFGFSLPFVVNQQVNLSGDRGEFANPGLTEVRGNFKYRFWGDSDKGVATIISFNQNLTENNPFTGAGAGPILNVEFALDATLYTVAVAANIGYRIRDEGSPVAGFPIEPLKDQIIASTALSKHFSGIDTKLIFEIFTATPVSGSSTESGRSVSASEALLGLKHDISRNIALHVGGSSEMDHGTSSPDWRFYTGINYVTGDYKNKKVRLVTKKRRKKKRKKVALPELPPSLSTGAEDYPAELPGIGDDVFVLRDVNFAFDSEYKVVAGAKKALKDLADHLRTRGYKKVVIEGHTDSIGSATYNSQLGKRRSMTIKKYLVEIENLDSSKIQAISYGEFRPVANNGNYQGRQINRRVVFRILYP